MESKLMNNLLNKEGLTLIFKDYEFLASFKYCPFAIDYVKHIIRLIADIKDAKFYVIRKHPSFNGYSIYKFDKNNKEEIPLFDEDEQNLVKSKLELNPESE